MNKKISIYKKFNPLKNDIEKFVDIIYKNFVNLLKTPQLKHNKDKIRKLLLSTKMIGYLVYYNNVVIGYIIGEEKDVPDGRHVFYITPTEI